MRACVAAILLLAHAAAALCAPPPRSSRLYEQWKKADTSADGELTRAEAAVLPRFAAQFDAIDRNADGRLSADEVRAWRKAAAAARRLPAAGRFEHYFKGADADGDGTLTRAETAAGLPRMAGRFERIDSDRDGRLSRGEVDAWLALRRSARRR
jgi:Ca2+-binding EF-hand superfamily protein